MILKEIQMDIPFILKGYSREESIRLYDETWKGKRREFHLTSRCMTSMIERLMPRIKTENYWKLLIECVEDSPRMDCYNMLGVCSVQVIFDIDLYFDMDNYEKKKYIILKVLEVINRLSRNGLSELNEIKRICTCVIDSNYQNEWYWKKAIKHNDKTAQIKIKHDVEKVSIYMVYTDSNSSKSEEVLLVEDEPDEWVYSRYLGKVEWVSEDKAQLITKDGTILPANAT